MWIIDGHPDPGFDVIGGIRFTHDGKHYAYGAVNETSGQLTGSIVRDGEIIANHPGEHRSREVFGPGRLNRGLARLRPLGHGISDPDMADDGTVYYAARLDKNNVSVVFNGAPGPVFEDVVSEIKVSRDGKHVAYIGKRGNSFIEVRDQKPGPSFPGGGDDLGFVEWIKLSADGSHLAYEITRNDHGASRNELREGDLALRRVVVDGKELEFVALDIPESTFRFTDDWKHYCYQVHAWLSGHADHFVVVDGKKEGFYDAVLDSARFIDSRTVRFVARQDRRLLRITHAVE
jgi:hypothetical protein